VNKLVTLIPVLVATSLVTGCSVMTPIGEEEFTCPNEKKGGVCAGPRSIYELTNSRPNLEGLDGSEDFDGYVITLDEDGKTIATKRERKDITAASDTSEDNSVRAVLINTNRHQYAPRTHAQHTDGNSQLPSVIPQRRNQTVSQDAFHQWPADQEPLAPEPLSVLEPPKVMRILINSYKDNDGNLHLPGYLYVQVEAEIWAFGEASALRPQRVIPTDILEQSQQAKQARDYQTQGVSPIEHTQR